MPAKNEEAAIGAVVTSARAEGFDVLVVDDCSTDATVAVARGHGATVIRLPFSAGAWGATQAGIRYALRCHYRWTVTIDADGQHDPAHIRQLLEVMCAGKRPVNVVVAACWSRGSPARRMACHVLRHLGGLGINDLTSGYRLYDRRAMEVVSAAEATLIEYQDVGVLLLLMRRGCRAVETSVPMCKRADGKSRIFRSWFVVAYYLAYSALMCFSKRRVLPGEPRQWHRETEG
ncbi:glycosyltransferase family 2 protein [Arhodomonas sp. AD133]|uniref:glycosyltransferase family 2 protein n=1 Tax=Arhodomonas sp. AD133 TaxID=3415009 RepID=UPI003EBB68CB